MVVGRAFHWTNGATRFYRHTAMFSTTGHLFLGLRGVESGIQIFWHIRENCRFCILGQFPFPTILQNSGLQTENFVLFTYILKNKAQTQIFDFSNLYKPLSISSANWMLLLCLAARRVAPAFTESKSIHLIPHKIRCMTGFYRIQINPLPHKIRWKGRTGFYRIQINPLPNKFIWSITE